MAHVFGNILAKTISIARKAQPQPSVWGSLLFFAIGPVMVFAGTGLILLRRRALAYYHLVKQHYGFMVLYKKKNNDLAPVDNALTVLLLLFAFNIRLSLL